ncbi:hypothetical protein DI09_148p50 [Mitosporidium daphniae]|uniref:Post-GPI attachment to proteins factor 3 n=1 Tax=Mitosporidium daphniae TaxID=1485682 RepID=A0A098VU57_9MICR|nr:uncharacterized protein DI09_148p50 [Mitosporidium daphniae]KGG52663.1 hypothetical protein DI09_148p50 [Mitosporidium daphniae]|eukprot:XP_013239099.1 uncharacterized protein DI09_148p50 [Mitosporidium daphniae]
MHEHSEATRSNGVKKYYGKWPFLRVFGMQEFFSVLFSLGNLYVHRAGYMHLIQTMNMIRLKDSCISLYTYFYYLNIATWLSSAAFHARDKPLTQFFDYSLALANVIYMAYIAIVRVFVNLGPEFLRLLALILGIYWAIHMYIMQVYHFDYSKHMKLCGFFAAVQTFVWIFWSFIENRSSEELSHLYWFLEVMLLSVLVSAADFPPFFCKLLDSHALWHAITMFAFPSYWYFLEYELIFSKHRRHALF